MDSLSFLFIQNLNPNYFCFFIQHCPKSIETRELTTFGTVLLNNLQHHFKKPIALI